MIPDFDPRPYIYFGGKASIMQDLVWPRFDHPAVFSDPFFGGGSSLLFNPDFDYMAGNWMIPNPPIETVNDIDGYISNFWRAVQADPGGVVDWCDRPVNENDAHAIHSWLVNNRPDKARLEGDMDYYDAKIAGLWVWGINQWIGSEYASGRGPWVVENGRLVKRSDGDAQNGVKRKLPHLIGAGQGINRQIPINSNGGGQCAEWREWLHFYFARLQDRLRRVRVCSGDWRRILGDTPTFKNGLTAVFLDPPYLAKNRDNVYNHDSYDVAHEVRDWAVERGDNPLFRIALCGYDGDYDIPETWEKINYSTGGGYEHQGKNGTSGNRYREVIYFSPYCLKPTDVKQLTMFAEAYG